MNNAQIDHLQLILSSEATILALQQHFREVVAEHRPEVESHITDEIIGQKYRAYNTATNMIEDAFVQLNAYRKDTTRVGVDSRHI